MVLQTMKAVNPKLGCNTHELVQPIGLQLGLSHTHWIEPVSPQPDDPYKQTHSVVVLLMKIQSFFYSISLPFPSKQSNLKTHNTRRSPHLQPWLADSASRRLLRRPWRSPRLHPPNSSSPTTPTSLPPIFPTSPSLAPSSSSLWSAIHSFSLLDILFIFIEFPFRA